MSHCNQLDHMVAKVAFRSLPLLSSLVTIGLDFEDAGELWSDVGDDTAQSVRHPENTRKNATLPRPQGHIARMKAGARIAP